MTGQSITGETNDYAIISEISAQGNNKTKERVILREMDVAIGDTIPVAEISEVLLRNRQFIFNTSLFQTVEINVKKWDSEAHTLELEIIVLEDWYIYPIPIFSLADRNLNVWIKDNNASLKRTSYGLRFYHFNTTGNRDRTRIIAQFGYEKQFNIGYNRPNINKAQTMGWDNSIGYKSRKEIAYATVDNKPLFLSDAEEDQFESLEMSSKLTYRPAINQYQSLSLGYVSNKVQDTLVQFLSPNFYLGSDDNTQKYFKLNYTFINDQRNFRTYPTKGSYYKGSVNKEGLGIYGDLDILNIDQTYVKYFEFDSKFSLEALGRMRYSIIRKQPPLSNYRGSGFGNSTIRGYELYQVDALDFGYVSTSLRYQIWNTEFKFGKIMPVTAYKTMPIQVLLTFNNDVGYSNDPFSIDDTQLNNQWLWGGGIGIDLMIYNDYVFQLEYNFNQLSESGLFIKSKLPF